jgi:hypothetical protein
MRLLAITVVLGLQTTALAQEAPPSVELGSPWEESFEVPAPPGTYPQVLGLDPEIAELQRAQRQGRPQLRLREPGIERMRAERPHIEQPGAGGRRHVSYARSFANAFGGFGIAAALGWLGGGILGGALCGNSGDCFFAVMMIGGISAAALAPFGAILGAWGFGELRGGTGNGWAALGLGLLGTGIGIGIGWGLVFLNVIAALVAGPIIGAFTTVLGAALGYHISQDGDVGIRPIVMRPERGEGVILGAMGTL